MMDDDFTKCAKLFPLPADHPLRAHLEVRLQMFVYMLWRPFAFLNFFHKPLVIIKKDGEAARAEFW